MWFVAEVFGSGWAATVFGQCGLMKDFEEKSVTGISRDDRNCRRDQLGSRLLSECLPDMLFPF